MVDWKDHTIGTVDWCCVTAGPLEEGSFGDPTSTPDFPVRGKTMKSVTFKFEPGNATITEGTVGWVEP